MEIHAHFLLKMHVLHLALLLAWWPVSDSVSKRDKTESMPFLKAPGGPVSFSYQLLSIDHAHFLKAAPLGQGQMDTLLLPKGGESLSLCTTGERKQKLENTAQRHTTLYQEAWKAVEIIRKQACHRPKHIVH